MSTPLGSWEKPVRGWRALKVVAKVRESHTITSFHLAPVEPGGWRPFRAGQFLVFKLPADTPAGHVLRHYSVSSSNSRHDLYRISVKREPAARPGLPAGVGSGYLHDEVAVGDVLQAEGPRGEFVLDEDEARPVLLLSGGVGLTPMVSMLHALVMRTSRRVYFVHACENGEVHALREEVDALAAQRPGVTVHYAYRSPTARDLLDAHHHSSGVLSRATLQALLSLDDYQVYLCGPPPFMQALYACLRGLGVAAERIAYEFFGPATVLDPQSAAIAPPAPAAMTVTETTDIVPVGRMVEFRASGRCAPWSDGTPSLLVLAESLGLKPLFSCRAGVCGSCRVGLISGEVTYFEEPLDPVPPNEVLLCCARPAGAVVIEL